MKIETTRELLLTPLSAAVGVVERKQTMPLLACVLVRAAAGHAQITGTDLEIEVTSTVAVHSDQSGSLAIPARKLFDIVKALPDDAPIAMDVQNHKLQLTSGNARFSLAVLDPQAYPSYEPIDVATQVQLPSDLVRKLIEKTQFSIAIQDVRYFLNGLLLELRDGSMRAVATDGHRLALCEMPNVVPPELFIQVIVPRKAVIELSRVFSQIKGDISLNFASNILEVDAAGSIRFVTKLIDGKYPDYDRVIPKGDSVVVSVPRENLRQALNRVAILSNEKYKGVSLEVKPNELILYGTNPEQEEASESLEIEYAGKEMSIAFNAGYMIDIVGAIDEDEVEIHLREGNSSSMILGKGNSFNRYIIMPMRI